MPRSSGGMDYKLYEKLEKKLLYWFEGCYIYDQVFSYRNLKRYFEFIENCKKDFLEKASSLGKGVVVTFSNDSLNFVFPDFHGDIELGKLRLHLVKYRDAFSEVLSSFAYVESFLPERPKHVDVYIYLKNLDLDNLSKATGISREYLTEERAQGLYNKLVVKTISDDTHEFVEHTFQSIDWFLGYAVTVMKDVADVEFTDFWDFVNKLS